MVVRAFIRDLIFWGPAVENARLQTKGYSENQWITSTRPVPGADLLMSNVYEELMRDVVDVKDLGSGVIGGI
ncbi:hypothetical protein ACC706_36400, partial [Rhizobium johnstonii]